MARVESVTIPEGSFMVNAFNFFGVNLMQSPSKKWTYKLKDGNDYIFTLNDPSNNVLLFERVVAVLDLEDKNTTFSFHVKYSDEIALMILFQLEHASDNFITLKDSCKKHFSDIKSTKMQVFNMSGTLVGYVYKEDDDEIFVLVNKLNNLYLEDLPDANDIAMPKEEYFPTAYSLIYHLPENRFSTRMRSLSDGCFGIIADSQYNGNLAEGTELTMKFDNSSDNVYLYIQGKRIGKVQDFYKAFVLLFMPQGGEVKGVISYDYEGGDDTFDLDVYPDFKTVNFDVANKYDLEFTINRTPKRRGSTMTKKPITVEQLKEYLQEQYL